LIFFCDGLFFVLSVSNLSTCPIQQNTQRQANNNKAYN